MMLATGFFPCFFVQLSTKRTHLFIRWVTMKNETSTCTASALWGPWFFMVDKLTLTSCQGQRGIRFTNHWGSKIAHEHDKSDVIWYSRHLPPRDSWHSVILLESKGTNKHRSSFFCTLWVALECLSLAGLLAGRSCWISFPVIHFCSLAG